MKKLILIIFLTMFFLNGCQEKKDIFSQTLTEIKYKDIKSIKLINTNKIIQKAFEKSSFKLNNKSKFTIEVQYLKFAKACNNPNATAEQKSYIGYMRFTLFEDEKKAYMCQVDFKKDIDVVFVKEIIEFMIDEIK